ncbi:MAG: hypothetical protein K9M19_03755 [Candidatus Marinimicrobia bacterium]|nr:hypothetical protein [Candidatus Neomarinimicrobiota bacterium]
MKVKSVALCTVLMILNLYGQPIINTGIWNGEQIEFTSDEVIVGLEESIDESKAYQFLNSEGLMVIDSV